MAERALTPSLQLSPLPTYRPTFMGREQMVSSGHYLASMAGNLILQAGGNAVDAGVATGICINVLQTDMTNFGGVAPIIIFMADRGEVATISGLGRWPRKASVAYFQEQHGGHIPHNILRSVTPAAAGAWLLALEKFGTMTFAQVVAPALRLAESGFPAHQFLHDNLVKVQKSMMEHPVNASVFFPGGKPAPVGTVLRQPDLARTFRRLSEVEARTSGGREAGLRAAREFFYQGEIAREIADFSRAHGGLMEYEDLASFSPRVEPPVRTTYRGYEVFGCGPWCQGPALLEALNILEGYDMRALGHNTAEYLHLVVSALDAAFSDRHAFYGDPDFVRVPIGGLLSKEYAAEWRARIDLKRAWREMPPPGDPWRHDPSGAPGRPAAGPATPLRLPHEADTSFCCAVDRWGNGFSATPSDGAREAALMPGLGFLISPRGHQSWVDESHPSSIEGGKRPRLTPNATLLLKDGRLEMVIGSPGLDVQAQAVLQTILAMIEFGMDPQAAIEQPRVASYNFPSSSDPHPYHPGVVQVERRIPVEVREVLAGMGHEIGEWPDFIGSAGAPCAIRVDHANGVLHGGADPRRMSYAVGW